MKTRSIFIALVLAIGVSTMGWADLNESDYRTVAENFLLYQNSSKNIVSADTIKDGERIIAYVMALEGGGYLLVPATTLLPPVKAYSLQSNFENLPPGYKAFLISELKTLQNEARISKRSSEPTENSARWDFLLSYKEQKVSLRYSPDTFLIKTKWGQSSPYNNKMPKLTNGQNALTGCVQTAWGQIMRYNQHPSKGKGVVTWTGITVVLNKNYNWSNMPDTLDTTTPEYQQDEVALLMRDLALVNQAAFSETETSTEYNKRIIIQYFSYSSAMKEMTNDNATFIDTLRNEINNDRPVFLGLPQIDVNGNKIGGHAVIADGYASDSTGKKIHLNMGWEGSFDNYHYIDGVTPIITDNGTFSTTPKPDPDPNKEILITMLYNIKPCSSANNDCYENTESVDSISDSTISGQFSNIEDIDAYPVYLKGTLTLSGNPSGGFFIRVYNSKFENKISATEPLTPISISSLAADKYYIDVSLRGEKSFYPYTGYPVSYTVNISAQSLTSAEISAIDNKNTAPVINNVLNAISVKNTAPYKIRIDSADADNGDTVTLSASSSNANVTVSMSNDVLTITPNVSNSYSKVTVTASDGKAQTTKSFDVFVTDALFGKKFTIADKFTSQSDFKKYKVVLDGNCTITGNNGNWRDEAGNLFTQGFYTAVKDSSDQSYIVPMTTKQDIMNTFPKESYLIEASLQYTAGGIVSSYPYQSGNGDSFTITVSCPDASEDAATIGGVLGISTTNTTYNPGLADVIQLLRILSGINTTYQWQDKNGDGKFGMEEAIYILQIVAGLR